MGYRYQKEVDALQLVNESNQWRQKIRTILFYVKDHPNLPVKKSLHYSLRVLIEFGRKRPEAMERLADLVRRIHCEGSDFRLLEGERKERLQKGLDILASLDRPNRTIDAIKLYAAQKDKDWDKFFRGDKAPMNELVAVARHSLEEFDLLVGVALNDKWSKSEERRKDYLASAFQRRKMMVFLCTQLGKKRNIEDVLREERDVAIRLRDEFARKYMDKHPSAQLNDVYQLYWKAYDKELTTTVKLFEQAKKGARLNYSAIGFPRIRYSAESKLSQLQSKFNRK